MAIRRSICGLVAMMWTAAGCAVGMADPVQIATPNNGASAASTLDAVEPGTALARQTGTTLPAVAGDGEVAGVVMASDRTELDASELASQKATDLSVRALAALLVDEHSNDLRALEALVAQRGITAAPSDASEQLTREAGRTLSALHDTATGAVFDAQFLAGQIRAHEETLHALDANLIPAAKDTVLRSALMDARAMVERHLAGARQIQQTLVASQ